MNHFFNKEQEASSKIITEKELLESISRGAFNVAISRQVKASVENILKNCDKVVSPNLSKQITRIKIIANAISIKQRHWIFQGEGVEMFRIAEEALAVLKKSG